MYSVHCCCKLNQKCKLSFYFVDYLIISFFLCLSCLVVYDFIFLFRDFSFFRFQNGEPVQAYVSVHSFGALYKWNRLI